MNKLGTRPDLPPTIEGTVSIETQTSGAGDGTRKARRRASTFSGSKLLTLFLQLLIVPAWLLVWQLTYKSLDPLVARSPQEVWDYLATASTDGTLWPALSSTLLATAIAFVTASVAGVIVGIGLALLPTVERVFRPYLDALNAMPRIALAPVLIIYFGIGMTGKVVLAFSLTFFVVMSGARAGVQSADPDVLRISQALGANRMQLFSKVYLHAASPAIFASLRLGFIYSLMGVVASELIAAEEGLGQLIAQYSSLFQMEGVWGVLLVLAVVAAVVNSLSHRLERRLTAWLPTEGANR